ncbi:hypothetical protein [Bacillus sp. (in: firmicutes)]|uniref:hypothetical protein n=1 Tax=Bacillus sp. TaxID=1409 RepID=UPI0023F4CA9D|nr:hypothetical protein [Bacillus sp. (in: firmicutes)]
MFKENIKTLVNKYLSKYNQIVDTLYKSAYSTNPEAFRLKDPSNIKIYVLKLSPILGANFSYQLYLTYEKDKNLELEIIDLTEEKHYEDYSKYRSPEDFITQKFLEKTNIGHGDILYTEDISVYNNLHTLTADEFTNIYSNKIWHDTFHNRMLILVTSEGRRFVEHANHPASYYAKNAAKYSYSLLDLKAIIDTVNDEDFSYQMDQAIAAYENSLYLASCATLGVCLETLCKLLLQKEGKKIKDSDPTMLDKLGQRLRENKIINYKLNSRIDVCYKIRNLSSHTSPGKVLQGDCHFIIATINEIVDTYFK